MKLTIDKKIFLYIIWFFWGIYGVIFNISFIDEGKYLIKGSLLLNGKVSYYQTPDFFYQHMPASLLWFGLGQKIFGPSLLIARVQSILLGLLIPIFTFTLASRMKNKLAGLLALLLLSLSPTIILYYSSATPTSLIALLFILGFLFLYQKRFLFSSFAFTLLFIVRENFLFTLGLYLVFLLFILRKNLKAYFVNFLLVVIILMVFLLPGYQEIVEILKNIPGLNSLLLISQEEKLILLQRWREETYGLPFSFIHLKALVQFWSIYQLWLLLLALVIFLFIDRVYFKKEKIRLNNGHFFTFLTFIIFFNLVAHSFAAYKFSPRNIIPYFPYFAPSTAVIITVLLVNLLKKFQLEKKRFALLAIFGFFCFSLPSLREASILTPPSKKPDLIRIKQSADQLKKIIPEKEKVLWLAEPLPLFQAGRSSYSPLVNHVNFYKSSPATEIVKNLGFWNQEMLKNWLRETKLVFIDPNKTKLLSQSPDGEKLVDFLESYLAENYQLIKVFDQNFWPPDLMWFERKNYLSAVQYNFFR